MSRTPIMAVGALALAGLVMMGSAAHERGARAHPRPLRFHIKHDARSAETSAQAPTLRAVAPIVIRVDATRSTEPNAETLHATLDTIAAAVHSARPAVTMVDASATTPDWALWARLGAPPAEVHVSDAAAVGVYAVRPSDGAALCLINRSGQKVTMRLQIRLPRGVYKLERLTFGAPAADIPASGGDSGRGAAAPGEPAAFGAPLTSGVTARAADAPAPLVQLKCLEGGDLAATGVISKPGVLEPGQVCLVRITDEAGAAWGALGSLHDALHAMALTTPGPARRLRHMLDEGDSGWGGLTAHSGRRKGVESRLSAIHHLLLVVSQVQSLHHNFQERKIVNAEPGGAVMGALERLSDALSETSAILSGLVPQIEVTPASTAGSDAGREKTVTVALANTGAHSVSLVKIGLDGSGLPAGMTCEPGDPALFSALRPGQTVRATFHLRGSAPAELPDNQCVGDVSYFTSGVPAHLRPRAW